MVWRRLQHLRLHLLSEEVKEGDLLFLSLSFWVSFSLEGKLCLHLRNNMPFPFYCLWSGSSRLAFP